VYVVSSHEQSKHVFLEGIEMVGSFVLLLSSSLLPSASWNICGKSGETVAPIVRNIARTGLHVNRIH
jgi:hypothetical protein